MKPIRTPQDCVAMLRQRLKDMVSDRPNMSLDTLFCIDNLIDTLENSIATPPASPWQPIDTAPRDGQLIDLAYPKLGRVCDCRWENDFNAQFPNGCWVHETDDDGPATFLNNEPTHWMPRPPLPEPPVTTPTPNT